MFPHSSVRIALLASILLAVALLPAAATLASPLPPEGGVVEPLHPGMVQPQAAPFPPAPKLAGAAAAAATVKWYSVAGAGFIPSSNTLTWSYAGSGCVHPGAAGAWRANLNLVDGSVVQYLWIGYWNAANSTATTGQLWKYDGVTGQASVIAAVTTLPGAAALDFRYASVSLPTPETIDNSWNSYMFVWQGPAAATIQELCYMQVGYTPAPVFASFMPAAKR